jgi:hypothetical protein
MHALGFFHEHTRSDRDKYVTIKWGNIPSDWAHNFKKCTERGCNDLKVGYDYGSVMHYGRNLGGKEAIVPKDKNARIGQRQALSPKDLIGLNEHYGCGSVTPATTQPPPSGNWNKLEKKHCWSEKLAGSYTTVEAAKLICSSNSACTGVYDQGCDAGPNDIYLCGAVPNGYSDSGFSCIYEKPKVVTYIKMEKKHCWGQKYGSYNTVADAKVACSSDAACTGVYDNGCNAEAGTIYLCGAVPNGYSTSGSSCVYKKQG